MNFLEMFDRLMESAENPGENKIKTFLIHYVNSADSTSEIVIKAADVAEARQKLKKQVGKNCFRVISIREVANSSFDAGLAENMASAFNELDKLWEE